MSSSIEELSDKLEAAKYVADPVTLKVVFLAAQMQQAVLVAGTLPGSGKTELAKGSLSPQTPVSKRLQCHEGINEEEAIGNFDESLQRLYTREHNGSLLCCLSSSSRTQHHRLDPSARPSARPESGTQ